MFRLMLLICLTAISLPANSWETYKRGQFNCTSTLPDEWREAYFAIIEEPYGTSESFGRRQFPLAGSDLQTRFVSVRELLSKQSDFVSKMVLSLETALWAGTIMSDAYLYEINNVTQDSWRWRHKGYSNIDDLKQLARITFGESVELMRQSQTLRKKQQGVDTVGFPDRYLIFWELIGVVDSTSTEKTLEMLLSYANSGDLFSNNLYATHLRFRDQSFFQELLSSSEINSLSPKPRAWTMCKQLDGWAGVRSQYGEWPSLYWIPLEDRGSRIYAKNEGDHYAPSICSILWDRITLGNFRAPSVGYFAEWCIEEERPGQFLKVAAEKAANQGDARGRRMLAEILLTDNSKSNDQLALDLLETNFRAGHVFDGMKLMSVLSSSNPDLKKCLVIRNELLNQIRGFTRLVESDSEMDEPTFWGVDSDVSIGRWGNWNAKKEDHGVVRVRLPIGCYDPQIEVDGKKIILTANEYGSDGYYYEGLEAWVDFDLKDKSTEFMNVKIRAYRPYAFDPSTDDLASFQMTLGESAFLRRDDDESFVR